MATRPAQVGETLISTGFRGTSTRGFASEADPSVAVCMLPGTKLAFDENIKYDNRWIWIREIGFSAGEFVAVNRELPHQHHDAVEFPDGTNVLVTLLTEGQKVKVVSIPGVHDTGQAVAAIIADANTAAANTAGTVADDDAYQAHPPTRAGGRVPREHARV